MSVLEGVNAEEATGKQPALTDHAQIEFSGYYGS